MSGINEEQKEQILDLWRNALSDFIFVNKNTLLRLNGPVATGVELDIQKSSSRYRSRIFVHSFSHPDARNLYFDGYRDYEYSSGQHGFGPKSIGTPEAFPDFMDRLRRETPLGSNLTLSKVIDFYQFKSAVGSNSFQAIAATALAVRVLKGDAVAFDYLDRYQASFSKWNLETRDTLGGSWEA